MMKSFIHVIKNGGDKVNSICYLNFFLFSFMFLVLLAANYPYSGSFIIKSIPVLSLSVLVFKNIKGSQGKLLFAGLLFSAAGDITLDLDRVKYFIPGLAFFLMAHIFYIMTMVKDYSFIKKKIIPAIFLIIYSSIAAYMLREIPQRMLIPVMLYVFVIFLMSMTALFMRSRSHMIFIGAVMFMISDTILAMNKFIYHIPYSTLFNISLYYGAQLLIVTGFLFEKKKIEE